MFVLEYEKLYTSDHCVILSQWSMFVIRVKTLATIPV